jgi:type VI secretion system protein ImpA
MKIPSIIEELLNPISVEKPSGDYLLYENIYDTIKEARRQEEDLPQGDWQRDIKKADWKVVQQLCFQTLAKQSKDLQLAVWWMESKIHLEGFQGVTLGLTLINQLCERFWDSIFPLPDEGDIENRISPLIWMDEKIPTCLGMLAITAPQDIEQPRYNFFDYQKVNQPQSNQSAGLSISQLQQSATLTPTTFYQNLNDQLNTSLQLLKQLNAFLDDKYQRHAPSLIKFREFLGNIQAFVLRILKERATDTPALPYENNQQKQMDNTNYNNNTGEIRSRDEAYQRLAQAADYLLRTEPHSPTPYLVKRAVSWGSLPLQELLLELVNDRSDLRALYTLLGMQAKDDD